MSPDKESYCIFVGKMLPSHSVSEMKLKDKPLGCEDQTMSPSLVPGSLYYFLILDCHGTLKHVCQKALGVIAPIEEALVQHQLLAVVNECYINWKTDFLNPLTFL